MEQGGSAAGHRAGCQEAPLHIAHAVVVCVNLEIWRTGRFSAAVIPIEDQRTTLQMLQKRTRIPLPAERLA